MVVRIRLQRTGRRNRSCFRICAFDGRTARDGKTLEILGHYDPLFPRQDEQISIKKERVEHWLSLGAQPSETVASICRRFDVTLPEQTKPKKKRKRGVQRAKKLAKLMAKKQQGSSVES